MQPDLNSPQGLEIIDFLRNSAITPTPSTLGSQSPEMMQIDIIYFTSHIVQLFDKWKASSFLLTWR